LSILCSWEGKKTEWEKMHSREIWRTVGYSILVFKQWAQLGSVRRRFRSVVIAKTPIIASSLNPITGRQPRDITRENSSQSERCMDRDWTGHPAASDARRNEFNGVTTMRTVSKFLSLDRKLDEEQRNPSSTNLFYLHAHNCDSSQLRHAVTVYRILKTNLNLIHNWWFVCVSVCVSDCRPVSWILIDINHAAWRDQTLHEGVEINPVKITVKYWTFFERDLQISNSFTEIKTPPSECFSNAVIPRKK